MLTKGVEVTVFTAYTGPGVVLFPLANMINLIIHGASGGVFRRVLRVEKINSGLNLTKFKRHRIKTTEIL